MKISTESIIGIIAVVVMLGIIIPSVIIDFKESKIERECFNDIAEDFCNERGWDYIGINGANRFFTCGDERTLLEDGYNYKFTNEERDYCDRYEEASPERDKKR